MRIYIKEDGFSTADVTEDTIEAHIEAQDALADEATLLKAFISTAFTGDKGVPETLDERYELIMQGLNYCDYEPIDFDAPEAA